jgi:hypothetical protein
MRCHTTNPDVSVFDVFHASNLRPAPPARDATVRRTRVVSIRSVFSLSFVCRWTFARNVLLLNLFIAQSFSKIPCNHSRVCSQCTRLVSHDSTK